MKTIHWITSLLTVVALSATAQTKSSSDIRIGQSVHLSGPLAATLQGVLKGQSLAIDEFNRHGGVNGRMVRLITLDDAFDAKRCAENVRKLIDEEGVVALTGFGSTANVAATLPILLEKKVPLIGVYSGSPVLRTQPHPYFFTNSASYADEAAQIVRTLVTQQKTRIAMVHNNPVMPAVVEAAAKKNGATLTSVQTLAANGSDAVAVVQSIAATKPDAVLYMTAGPSLVPFVKAVRTYLGVPIYAVSVANSQVALKALGDDARGLAFTSIVPYPWRQTSALTKDFDAVMKRANLTVDYDHMFGYLNMRIVLEAVRRAGKSPTPQAITNAVEGMSKVDLGGYRLSYSPQNHHGASFVEILIVGPGGRYMR